MKSKRPEWVILMTVAGALEADMRKAALESHGIPVTYRSDAVPNSVLTGETVGPIYSVALMVPADRVEEARRILEGDAT